MMNENILAYAVLRCYIKDNHPFGIFCSFHTNSTMSNKTLVIPK